MGAAMGAVCGQELGKRIGWRDRGLTHSDGSGGGGLKLLITALLQ